MLLLGIRVFFIVVFSIAAVSKARTPKAFRSFAASLADLGIRLPSVRRAMASGVIACEAAIVALLLRPTTASYGLVGATLMMLAFTGVTTSVVSRGGQMQCECFGAAGEVMSTNHIVRNAMLAIVAGIGAAMYALGPGSAPLGEGAPALIVGAAAGLLVARWDDLYALVFGSLHELTGSGLPPH